MIFFLKKYGICLLKFTAYLFFFIYFFIYFFYSTWRIWSRWALVRFTTLWVFLKKYFFLTFQVNWSEMSYGLLYVHNIKFSNNPMSEWKFLNWFFQNAHVKDHFTAVSGYTRGYDGAKKLTVRVEYLPRWTFILTSLNVCFWIFFFRAIVVLAPQDDLNVVNLHKLLTSDTLNYTQHTGEGGEVF